VALFLWFFFRNVIVDSFAEGFDIGPGRILMSVDHSMASALATSTDEHLKVGP
jgi:hypothetical protein